MMTHLRRIRWDSVLLGLLLLACILPLLWTVLASFGLMPNNNLHPPVWRTTPTLDYYIEVGVSDPVFLPSLLNSLALAAATTLVTVIVAFLMVYALAHSRLRGRKLLIQICLVLASIPVISYVMPLQNTLRGLQLYDNFAGLVLSEAALFSPLAAYVLYGYISSISPEFEEAARLDGAGLPQMLRRVILPIVAPGVAATGIIIFVLSWNQLLMPLILSGRIKTIPKDMIDFFTLERELEWPVAASALVVSLLPVGIVVALAHRLLEQFRITAIHHT